MGIGIKTYNYFKEMTSLLGYDSFDSLRMCQLGDARIRKGLRGSVLPYRGGREYFSSIGFDVTTIDLGIGSESIGSYVEKKDLSYPIEGLDKFDFITDFGTGEHVGNQYELHSNINNMMVEGGIIIRVNPFIGTNHGSFKYSIEFYYGLVSLIKYLIVDIRITPVKYYMHDKLYLFVCMKKIENCDFHSLEEFNRACILS